MAPLAKMELPSSGLDTAVPHPYLACNLGSGMHYSAGPEAEAPELRRVLDQKPLCHRRADLADRSWGGRPAQAPLGTPGKPPKCAQAPEHVPGLGQFERGWPGNILEKILGFG